LAITGALVTSWVSVRMMVQDDNGHLQPCTQDVPFEMGLCG
jgi:hypothetical protein